MCIAAEDNDADWCRYYTDTAKIIKRLEPQGFARQDMEDVKQEVLGNSGQDQQNITLR